MKIRSSKELKESIQNIDRVIENELIDTTVAIDPILADAYEQNKEIEIEVEKTLEELTSKAEDLIVEDPTAPIEVENAYTKQLKLDESIEDFRLHEDGRKNRIAARDENDTDLYLDYDMSEFVYELFSAGSKGITNIAPVSPLVKHKKKDIDIEIKAPRFSPNGSQVNNRQYILLFDLSKTCSRDVAMGMKKLPADVKASAESFAEKADIQNMSATEAFDAFVAKAYTEAEKVYEENKNKFKDSAIDKDTYIQDLLGYTFIGFTKELSTPQIGQAGYDTVIYSNDIEKLDLARKGAAAYSIDCGPVVPRKSITSHWEYSMVVYCPKYSDGEPMLLEDFLDEHSLTLDDVFEPKVAARFKNAYAKADSLDAELKLSMKKEEIIDKYADMAMDIDPDDTEAMEALYAEMCEELTAEGIKCDKEIKRLFSDETGYEF